MLRSLWLLMVYVSFVGLGTVAPFILTLGYVWVDTFRPQEVAYIILNQFPVAMTMGAAAFVAYLGMDRRMPPRPSLTWAIQVFMALWVTVTLVWAVAPEGAMDKWDWASKTIAFSAFIPFVIRSRVQIEAFAQTYVFSLAANFVPYGIKTTISGGGYGANLGLSQGNAGLAEGGLLSTVCLMAVPLAVYLGSYSMLMPRSKLVMMAYWGIAALAIITAVGTFERSALIGLVMMASYMLLRSRRKVLFGLVIIAGIGVAAVTSSDKWSERMATTKEYQQESSALTRILVWKWTLDFAVTHPFGGGFDSYRVNHIEYPPDAGHPGGYTVFGRAFHSIYFEVLGEQGWPGLGMFLYLGFGSIFSLRRLSRRIKDNPDFAWCSAMSDALQSGFVVFLTSGAFVGIAFQPMFWYFVSMTVCLREYVRRTEALKSNAAPQGWRSQSAPVMPFGTSMSGRSN